MTHVKLGILVVSDPSCQSYCVQGKLNLLEVAFLAVPDDSYLIHRAQGGRNHLEVVVFEVVARGAWLPATEWFAFRFGVWIRVLFVVLVFVQNIVIDRYSCLEDWGFTNIPNTTRRRYSSISSVVKAQI